MDVRVRSNAAALDIPTGEIVPWSPQPNTTVMSISAIDTAVARGGLFTRINIASYASPRIELLRDHLALVEARDATRSNIQTAAPNDRGQIRVNAGSVVYYVASASEATMSITDVLGRGLRSTRGDRGAMLSLSLDQLVAGPVLVVVTSAGRVLDSRVVVLGR
jgi:hypothetical protein